MTDRAIAEELEDIYSAIDELDLAQEGLNNINLSLPCDVAEHYIVCATNAISVALNELNEAAIAYKDVLESGGE